MEKQIREQVGRLLDELSETSRIWRLEWITREVEKRYERVLKAWAKSGGEDESARFYEHCSHTTVRAIVSNAIRSRTDPDRTPDDQLVFEGFPRVQAYYTITRQKEWMGVPVMQLTQAEQTEKVAELRSSAEALLEHADQLELFFNTYGELGA
ncbi:hypothetical protein LCGC14_0877470 [marine sediment metagenome]|uniref:Uncharacterized protein n=1 Tax=marine sediment metagenome TaxID=412755 RepID=A0A0F9RMH4_9ZZZZ